MQCYSELIPPSGVTKALCIPFISANTSNLILARTSLLQIFTHKQVNQGQDTKLILLSEYRLPGTVTSLGRVKISNTKSGGEAILVALRNAKLSLIEWDPVQYNISTISIHYYENYEIQAAPWGPDLREFISYLTVDPSNRCAAFNFGFGNLAIIPFRPTSDDLAMDDFDEELDEKPTAIQIPGEVDGNVAPYFPSFVLPLTVLDPGLLNPIDLAFLYEYRDPTIGILYSNSAQSVNLSAERKDVVIYAVYALDLDQRASTTLLSVQKLPNDLCQIVALPLPVGGALLIGGNELVHIDQGGKSNAIGVNEFARETSSFPMSDHSEHRLRLEGCQVEQIGNPAGDMLILLSNGDFMILTFRLDGRSVSGMSLRRIESEFTADILKSSSSCTALIGTGRLFIGSEESDSVLISTARKPSQLKRQGSKMQSYSTSAADDEYFDRDDDSENEDDLYGTNAVNGMNGHGTDTNTINGSNFRLLDRLPCIAPLQDVTFGRPPKRKHEDEMDQLSDAIQDHLQLVASCGRGRAGGIAILSRQISPRIAKRLKYKSASGVWCFDAEEAGDEEIATNSQPDTRRHVILSSSGGEHNASSSLFTIQNMELQPKLGTEFDEAAGPTIAVGQLVSTRRVAQVTPIEVRVYDSDFGLSQIFPIVDEEEGQMARAVQANFVEPYLVILKDDKSILLLKADRNGDLDEVDVPDLLKQKQIACTNLYADESDFFNTSRYYDESPDASNNLLLSIATFDGFFYMLSLPNIHIKVFESEGLAFLATQLAQDAPIPKHWRHKDEITEIVLADLGDGVDQKPHLILRNAVGDIVIYQPFAVAGVLGTYRFIKVATRNAETVDHDSDDDEFDEMDNVHPPIQVLRSIDGSSLFFVPGSSPCIILKTATTMPHIYKFGLSKVKSISNIHGDLGGYSVMFIDGDDNVCTATIPSRLLLCNSDWAIEKVELGREIASIAYFEPTRSYVLSANYPVPFQLPQDDEWHQEWQGESTDFLPVTTQSSLTLLSSETHTVLSQYHFEAAERVLCVKSCNLEVSEETHERKQLLVVGTAITKGENVVTRGNIYIFDVVDVVPNPEVPETNLKLKMLTREDVRGAVTAITEVGSQGFVLAVQGQKCMVRGLKEDNSLLPVAFLDMRYYVKVAKSLKGTGLCILGDAFSGLWLTGYSEEPYKMQFLGSDLTNPDVLAAEFLPDGRNLFIITSDGDGHLRILQYDPENPKTERGSKLLLRSTFNTGLFPTGMTLLPRLSVHSEHSSDMMDLEDASSASQILVTTQEGALVLITSLSEQSYRRLSTLQNILITNLEHPCGLNPRAYRQVETDGIGGRGMIDGNLVRRWLNQSSQHKASTADKVGGTVWDVRTDLKGISGSGLGFLV